MGKLARYYKIAMAACFVLLFAFNGNAQGRTPKITEGQVVDVFKTSHSPAKATLYSALLPGLGQAYNKKYWKMPIIYVGLGATVYFGIWNNQQYNTYSNAFDIQEAGGVDEFGNYYSPQNLITLQNYYRNNRDLAVVLGVLVYGLNILDANIDAHLFDFDVSDDISLRASPTVFKASLQNQNAYGVNLTFNFK